MVLDGYEPVIENLQGSIGTIATNNTAESPFKFCVSIIIDYEDDSL